MWGTEHFAAVLAEQQVSCSPSLSKFRPQGLGVFRFEVAAHPGRAEPFAGASALASLSLRPTELISRMGGRWRRGMER